MGLRCRGRRLRLRKIFFEYRLEQYDDDESQCKDKEQPALHAGFLLRIFEFCQIYFLNDCIGLLIAGYPRPTYAILCRVSQLDQAHPSPMGYIARHARLPSGSRALHRSDPPLPLHTRSKTARNGTQAETWEKWPICMLGARTGRRFWESDSFSIHVIPRSEATRNLGFPWPRKEPDPSLCSG